MLFVNWQSFHGQLYIWFAYMTSLCPDLMSSQELKWHLPGNVLAFLIEQDSKYPVFPVAQFTQELTELNISLK